MSIGLTRPATPAGNHAVHREGEDSIDGFETNSARRPRALKSRPGRVRPLKPCAVLRAHDITARQFGGRLAPALNHEAVMLAGHPERSSKHAERGRTVTMVETLRDRACSWLLRAATELSAADASGAVA